MSSSIADDRSPEGASLSPSPGREPGERIAANESNPVGATQPTHEERSLPLLARVANAPFIAIIYAYRFTLSPFIGGQCRFTPTCSVYALECYRRFGPLRATRLTLWRILRCNPFGGHGFDPPPTRT